MMIQKTFAQTQFARQHAQRLRWMFAGAAVWVTGIASLGFLLCLVVSRHFAAGFLDFIVRGFGYVILSLCAVVLRFWIASDVVVWQGGPPSKLQPRIFLYALGIVATACTCFTILLSASTPCGLWFMFHGGLACRLWVCWCVVGITAFALATSPALLCLRVPLIQHARILRVRGVCLHNLRQATVCACGSALTSVFVAWGASFLTTTSLPCGVDDASVSCLCVACFGAFWAICTAIGVADCVLTQKPLPSAFALVPALDVVMNSDNDLLKLHTFMVLSERAKSPAFRAAIYNDTARTWELYCNELLAIITAFTDRLCAADGTALPSATNTHLFAADLNGLLSSQMKPHLTNNMKPTVVQKQSSIFIKLGEFAWQCVCKVSIWRKHTGLFTVMPRDLHRTNSLFADWLFVSYAANLLSLFATSSLLEDSVGVVQQSLPDIMSTLLNALFAIRAHVNKPDLFLSPTSRIDLEAHRIIRRIPFSLAAVLERCVSEMAQKFSNHLHRLVHPHHVALIQPFLCDSHFTHNTE